MALMSGRDLEAVHLRIADASGIGEARRRAERIATALSFDETVRGRAAIVVQEMATNALRHAGRGELFLRVTERDRSAGLEVICVDSGPGIEDVGKALRDGYSTGGSAGTGLGAIQRLSQRFDVFAMPQRGTVVVAEIWSQEPARSIDVSSLIVPIDPDGSSGDAVRIRVTDGQTRICLVDALGHGAGAAETAAVALAAFDAQIDLPVSEVFREIDACLRPTRGAAVAVVEIDRTRGLLRAAGVGNIIGRVVGGERDHSLVFSNGIAGHNTRRYDAQQLPWPRDGLLVLHTDGIRSHWDASQYVSIARRHPGVAAALLYRDHRRGYDDIGVVAVTEAAARR